MIKKIGVEQSSISSADFEGPSGKADPESPPSGIAEYTDSLETANATGFDFSRFGNPAGDRSIIVVGGKSHAGEVTLGSSDGIQLQDANFEGAHSSLSGEIGTNSLSLGSLKDDAVDGAGDVIDWTENTAGVLGYEATHPADILPDSMYYGAKGVDDVGSAVGKFFQDTPVSDVTKWFGGAAEDTGEVLGDGITDAGGFFNDLLFHPAWTIQNALNDTGLGGLISDAGDTASDAADTGGAVFQGAIEATTGAAGDALDALGDAAKDAGNWLVDKGEDVINTVGDLF